MKPALISNRKLTLLRKLNRKKYRRLKYLFLAEGERAVRQIIKNGLVAIDELFFDESQQFWQQEPWKSLASAIHSSIILKRDFDSVSDTENPQGVIALCKMPEEAQPEILASQSGVMIAADAVQDPGNLGTMIRTASWFSVNGILSGKGTVDLFHPKVVRSTAGATGVIPYINGNLSELLTFLKNGIGRSFCWMRVLHQNHLERSESRIR